MPKAGAERLPRLVNVDPVTRFVRALPGEWFMLKEVAHQVGVSPFTLRRYIDEDITECLPSKLAEFGKIHVYLYSKKDVARIEKYLKDRVIVTDFTGKKQKANGRPKVYTKEERATRKRMRSRKWYWESRLEVLKAQGDTEGVQYAKEQIKEIEKELEDSVKG